MPMNTTTWVVPMVNRLTGNRQTIRIEARNATHAIESAQELWIGWAAQFPVRRAEQWA